MTRLRFGAGLLALMMGAAGANAQSVTNMAALKGLAPVSALLKTADGQAALASNFTATGGIQTGAIRQPTLLPFAEQQQQALRDAFITDGNLFQLTDGFGTTLAAAYAARAHYLDKERFTSISRAVSDVIAYANSTSGSDSNAGKYFFANGTANGKKPVSDEALAIFKNIDGAPDPFGIAYRRPAGTPGADKYGDSRPFQTEPTTVPIVGLDYFNVPASNEVYNQGPVMNLIDSPSFPSGHTTYGYMGSLLLAELVPDRFQEMIVRAAEYGNDRIIMGAHYAMDVLGGRTVATYDLAHLLANDPSYVGRPLTDFARSTAMSEPRAATIDDFRAAVATARADVTKTLEAACGDTIAVCARQDTGRFNATAMNEAFYATTQTYGLGVAHPEIADKVEDVATLAPEAGYLLTVAFPKLSLDEANRILTETEGPGGGFLDDGSGFGVYSRLNLYAAAGRAAALSRAKP
jgi:PAP2 superfamily